jgi:esterase/lipase superfamily enzyme
MKTPLTVFVSKDDKALRLSSFLRGGRQRVGRLDVDKEIVEEAAASYRVRVIDVTSLKAIDELGHDRYAELASLGPQLAILDQRPNSPSGEVGAFVFNAATSVISSPLRLARGVVGGR